MRSGVHHRRGWAFGIVIPWVCVPGSLDASYGQVPFAVVAGSTPGNPSVAASAGPPEEEAPPPLASSSPHDANQSGAAPKAHTRSEIARMESRKTVSEL